LIHAQVSQQTDLLGQFGRGRAVANFVRAALFAARSISNAIAAQSDCFVANYRKHLVCNILGGSMAKKIFPFILGVVDFLFLFQCFL
jgi:hypothetical protein